MTHKPNHHQYAQFLSEYSQSDEFKGFMRQTSQDPLLMDMASLAMKYHGEQLRADGETPYIAHIITAFNIVNATLPQDYPNRREVLAATIGHDIFEDATPPEKARQEVADTTKCHGADTGFIVDTIHSLTIPEIFKKEAHEVHNGFKETPKDIRKALMKEWQAAILSPADRPPNHEKLENLLRQVPNTMLQAEIRGAIYEADRNQASDATRIIKHADCLANTIASNNRCPLASDSPFRSDKWNVAKIRDHMEKSRLLSNACTGVIEALDAFSAIVFNMAENYLYSPDAENALTRKDPNRIPYQALLSKEYALALAAQSLVSTESISLNGHIRSRQQTQQAAIA